jgi:hypothetical protein
MRRFSPHTLPLVALVTILGCSDSSGPADPPPVPTTLTVVEGASLQAPAGTVLSEGPTVLLKDQYGDPVQGATVSFQVVEGGGIVVHGSQTTDASGRARNTWILGRTPGSSQRLSASAGALSVDVQAQAVAGVVGESYFGRSNYVEYFPGNLPMVLSAPHGGNMHPDEIPDRTWGTTVQDRNTMDLALRIRSAIHAETGGYPYIIVTHLHRVKLDNNREIVEAAQGDPEAERAWWEHHTFIEEARRLVEESFGEGLYIDLHGHGHPNPRLELGYLLSRNDLTRPDENLDDAAYVEKSSFRTLGSKAGVDFADLIRGPLSLGTLFEAQGYPAVPSQAQPDPGGEPFFSGGYSTWRHGSRDGSAISGVQIECNYPGVRDSAPNRQAFAEALADILPVFFPTHFGMEFASLAGAATQRSPFEIGPFS